MATDVEITVLENWRIGASTIGVGRSNYDPSQWKKMLSDLRYLLGRRRRVFTSPATVEIAPADVNIFVSLLRLALWSNARTLILTAYLLEGTSPADKFGRYYLYLPWQ